MYLFEIIAKYIRNYNINKSHVTDFDSDDSEETCDHVFMAIDSTKDYLACNKCGFVISNKLKNDKKNIFKL